MGNDSKNEIIQRSKDLQCYLQPTRFIDSDSPAVIGFARSSVEDAETDIERAIRLYYSVRDGIRCDPYHIGFAPEALKASSVLARKTGFCVEKAVLLELRQVDPGPCSVGFRLDLRPVPLP